jgi:hypothetical protein
MKQILRRLITSFLSGAALFGACTPGFAQSAPPMTFETVSVGNPAQCGNNCVRVIVARGEIVSNTPEQFLEFVRRVGARDKRMRAVIFVESPGGLVVSSMRLGVLFRKLGAAAVVGRVNPSGGPNQFYSATCASACVYALMGAKKRVVPPQSRIVLHRMYAFERAGGSGDEPARLQKTFSNRSLEQQLSSYARMMGVSPEVIRTAESIQPDAIKVLSQAELRRWRLSVPAF